MNSPPFSTYTSVREGRVDNVTVIDTIEWLTESPLKIDVCKKLQPYFSSMKPHEISKYLQSFGMYRHTTHIDLWLEKKKNEKVSSYVKRLEKDYKAKWGGPEVPIFILPADDDNRKINNEYFGRSGLAFHNKLFLFLTIEVRKEDLTSLFLHEYHHVSRLSQITKRKMEKDFTIIDAILMEGLAENAVREELGEEYVASWAKKYSNEQCERFYQTIIIKNKEITRDTPLFSQILYGTGFYPSMVGYSVGYFLVKKYMDKTGKKTKDLLGYSSEEFI